MSAADAIALKAAVDPNGNGIELTSGWPSHDIGRIGHVQAGDQLAQFAQVLVGEQQVLVLDFMADALSRQRSLIEGTTSQNRRA